jgi:ribosome-interacting GTPase 1
MNRTQKNKATAKHLGLLKAKLAKLKRELITPAKGAGAVVGEGFDVTKTGDSRIGLVGSPPPPPHSCPMRSPSLLPPSTPG